MSHACSLVDKVHRADIGPVEYYANLVPGKRDPLQ